MMARSQQNKNFTDLNTAISAFQQVVETARNPVHAGYFTNLGLALLTRFEQAGQLADLNGAIKTLEQAVEASPAHHPDSAKYLSNLAGALKTRFEHIGHLSDLDTAASSFHAALEVTTATPRVRMTAAMVWGRLSYEAGDIITATEAYAAALELLPQVAWHGLDRPTQEKHLSNFLGLASEGASSAIASGAVETDQVHRALEMLEQGRSVLWTETLHIRSDLTRLHERAPELAERLDQIRRQLNRPSRDNLLKAMALIQTTPSGPRRLM